MDVLKYNESLNMSLFIPLVVHIISGSEALSVNDIRTIRLVLFLGDPHVLELLDLREDGTTQPAGIFAIGRTFNSRGHVRRRQSCDLLAHAFLHALEHGAATCQNNVFEQISLDVRLALENRIKGVFLKTIFARLILQARLEEHFWDADQLFTNRYHIPVRQFMLN